MPSCRTVATLPATPIKTSTDIVESESVTELIVILITEKYPIRQKCMQATGSITAYSTRTNKKTFKWMDARLDFSQLVKT